MSNSQINEISERASCIFCKVANKQMPHYPVYENDDVLAFLDIHPLALGHTLLITKKHFDSLEMASETIRAQMINTVAKLRPILTEATGANYTLAMIAGIDVKHFHIHLIPQKEDSVLSSAKPIEMTPEQFEKIRNTISEQMPA
ncbi:MAG: HIT family protein [Minisyncoccia bacterium]